MSPFAGAFTDKMDKILLVIRSPLKSAIAEFNRRSKSKEDSFSSVESFKRRASKHHFFAKLFRNLLRHFFRLATRYNKIKKPVLFISYEDMTDNLLPNLLRISKFLNLGSENEEVLERSVCTILSDSRIKQSTKRTYKVDLTKAARSLIDKKQAIGLTRRIGRIFQKFGRHEMRTDEYLSMIEGWAEP